MSKHVYKPRHCEAADLFTINSDEAEVRELTGAANSYLSTFVAPIKNSTGNPVCFNCGEEISGFKAALGLGIAYRWTLAHGEAECSGCGWPARGMHYLKDPSGDEVFSLRNLFLSYHPDFVEAKGEAS